MMIEVAPAFEAVGLWIALHLLLLLVLTVNVTRLRFKEEVGFLGPNQWDGLLLTHRHLCARLVMNHQLTVN